jgi:NAD(P)H dehydrogenase (quinone)
MRRSIDALARAIAMSRPKTVLAISDYGAHLPNGAGLTTTFHWLEEALRAAAPNLVLVRSAEHMQNWARVLAVAAATGAQPSLHHPLTKLFPTVSAFDVGAICAELLLAPKRSEGVRVVHVEGPKRYTPEDVASATSTVLGRNVAAHELPRSDWEALLSRGMSVSYARLVAELYDAHNAGRIDVEEGGEIRRGPSDLVTAFAAFAPKRGH